MEQEKKLLMQALRSAVTEHTAQVPSDVDWKEFLRFVKIHNVEALVCSGLKGQQLPEDVRASLQAAYHHAIFRDAQLEHIKNRLQTLLTEAQVPHIFLKGAVLKHHYPIPALRTMTDLDILVYTRDYKKIDQVAQNLGGTRFAGDGNHRNFLFPGNVKVEFHPNLLHHATPVATAVNPGWQYARQDSAGTAKLTEEGFYLSILCHMAEHFVTSGIGVRFVLDVWVFHNLRGQPVDRSFVEAELKRFGLLEFVQNIEQLSRVWFDGEPTTPEMEELGEYILTSGIHGTQSREMLNALSMSGGRAGALWKKAFYPRQELEDRYPWAKGRSWLLPAAWVARAVRAVTKHGSNIKAWGKGTGDFTLYQIREQKEKLERFGIKREK